MKITPILYSLISLALLCHCRAGKQAVATYKTIAIDYSEMYCGGAAPPDEMITEMATMKPFANSEIMVYLNSKDSKPLVYKTNNEGKITLKTNEITQVFISIYHSADLYIRQKEMYDCYKKFITDNLMIVDMNNQDTAIKLATVKQCNPCLPAAP